MIISHTHKFIFFEMGKTGTTSIAHVLKKYESPFELSKREQKLFHKHMPPVFLKEKVPAEIWDNYFKFSFVRNTWDWLVSDFFWNKLDRGRTITTLSCCDIYSVYDNQKRFRRGIDWEPTRFQYASLADRQGNLLVDFIGRFENIDDDFNTICERIGIPCEKLPVLNKTKHTHYSDYYTPTVSKLVYQLYRKDIEYFGYTCKDATYPGPMEKMVFKFWFLYFYYILQPSERMTAEAKQKAEYLLKLCRSK